MVSGQLLVISHWQLTTKIQFSKNEGKFSKKKLGLMDKIQAKKLHKPLFYLPLQAFEKMNKKSAFTVVVK